MSDFIAIRGFEDVWRPAVRANRRAARGVIGALASPSDALRAKLTRLVQRAPEVMVKVTGRTHELGGLRAHLNYISRNAALPLEDRDGARLESRSEMYEAAAAWEASAQVDSRRRANTPLSHSIILSMPAGTNAFALRDAARAFAEATFAGEHDYLFTLHTDTPRPHVHLAVCSRADSGRRLNPHKADLEAWRQTFAEALRDRCVEAEATPRRARGVSRKAERGPLRRIRQRAEAGSGTPARVVQSAYRHAARAAFQGDKAKSIWEGKLVDRQVRIRALYLAQADLLKGSADPTDRALGAKVETFVRNMPAPDTQRLALARELREANARLHRAPEPAARNRAR